MLFVIMMLLVLISICSYFTSYKPNEKFEELQRMRNMQLEKFILLFSLILNGLQQFIFY